MDIGYDYQKILRELDDSLFRLKQITRSNSGTRYSNSKKSRSSIATTQNKTSTAQIRIKGQPVDIDKSKEINRPSQDRSCMNRYPISCVSNNWEIIRCYIIFQPGTQDDEKRAHQTAEVLSRRKDDMPISSESGACFDFQVHLEHIRYTIKD